MFAGLGGAVRGEVVVCFLDASLGGCGCGCGKLRLIAGSAEAYRIRCVSSVLALSLCALYLYQCSICTHISALVAQGYIPSCPFPRPSLSSPLAFSHNAPS